MGAATGQDHLPRATPLDSIQPLARLKDGCKVKV